MKTAQLAFLMVAFLFSGCGPLDGLYKKIEGTGHIPFKNPLAYSETGTLVGGTPDHLQLVAPPETCFPKAINGVPTNLRFRDDTALPNESRLVSVGFDANVNVLKGLSSANGTLNVGVNFGYVQKMELTFEGVHVEYMDSIRLTQLYRESMGSLCKDYLDQVAFIIQAIQADKMTFKFYSKSGAALKLSMDNIKEIIDIGADLNFEIENNVSLVITTPKYLGYQLGKLQRKDNGLAFYRSTRVKKGRFVFDPISVFDPSRALLAAAGFDPFDASPDEFLPFDPKQAIRLK